MHVSRDENDTLRIKISHDIPTLFKTLRSNQVQGKPFPANAAQRGRKFGTNRITGEDDAAVVDGVQDVLDFWQRIMERYSPRPWFKIGKVVNHLLNIHPGKQTTETTPYNTTQKNLQDVFDQRKKTGLSNENSALYAWVEPELLKAIRIYGNSREHGFGPLPASIEFFALCLRFGLTYGRS